MHRRFTIFLALIVSLVMTYLLVCLTISLMEMPEFNTVSQLLAVTWIVGGAISYFIIRIQLRKFIHSPRER